MEIRTNIPLKNYTTMKLGGPARFMINITKPEDIPALVENARSQNLPLTILGGGSNTIVGDAGFNGIVARINISGINEIASDLNTATFRIGAGVIWDSLVKFSVDKGLSGIEAMSAIPGTVGAAPVQNIGAYGQELADTFVKLEAFDTESLEFVELSAADCEFSYRSSIFRESATGRYIITAVVLELSRNQPTPPFYKSLQTYLDNGNITIFTHQTIRDAVIAIRQSKLPDPKEKPNAGSFFKNPIIDEWLFREILEDYPDAPYYDMPEKQIKIPAGWLIEQAGLKGTTISGIHVHDDNAVVLINQSANSYDDLAAAREQIVTAIRNQFRIDLVQEPLELL